MSEHIRIGDVAPRVQYVGDGARRDFTFPFPIFDADDLEIRVGAVVLSGGYSVAGAGASGGGSVQLATPPSAGATVTLRRRVRVERNTDFQDNGVLRARTLNDELDRLVAVQQEQRDEIGSALRQDPSEIGGLQTLPIRMARANRLLGFDSNGDTAVFPRDSGLLTAPYQGAIPRTAEDKLGERLSARDFGATGNGVSDDGPALQAAMNAAAAAGKTLLIGEGSHRTTIPLTLPGAAAGLIMRGAIVYAGAAGQPALTIGDGGAARNANKILTGLTVLRASIGDWLNAGDIGLVLRNLDASLVEIREISGFTIGVRTLGDGRGFEDTTLVLGRIVNNGIGLDVHCATAAAWNTSVRYYGGHFAVGSSVNVTRDRFGIRLSAAPGAYVAHNRHLFDGPNFELNSAGKPGVSGIPFLCEVNSRAVIARAMRMERCSDLVARHTAAAEDHVYDVAWADQGYRLDVEYTPTATRYGGVVLARHRAAPHVEASRPLAAVPNLRAAAIRWNATEIGFEQLAVLSSNVSGSPAALRDFAFPALDNLALTQRGVLIGGGRALGFVVDARHCKHFALAVDADWPRLMVMTFDAGMNLLTDAAGQAVLASGQSISWNPTARWWQGNSDMGDVDRLDPTHVTLTRLQAVHLSAAVGYAVIGVARLGADYEIRAMRLFCDPRHAPSVLYGQPGLPHGARELIGEAAWDPPSIAAGGTAQVNVTVPGARPGDFAHAAFSLATILPFIAQVSAGDTVTVAVWNRTGGVVDLGAGTVRVRVVKA